MQISVDKAMFERHGVKNIHARSCCLMPFLFCQLEVTYSIEIAHVLHDQNRVGRPFDVNTRNSDVRQVLEHGAKTQHIEGFHSKVELVLKNLAKLIDEQQQWYSPEKMLKASGKPAKQEKVCLNQRDCIGPPDLYGHNLAVFQVCSMDLCNAAAG